MHQWKEPAKLSNLDILLRKAGDVPGTPLTPADLDAVHRHTVESAALKRKVAYLTSPDFAVAVLARLDALEAQVAALEASGATG